MAENSESSSRLRAYNRKLKSLGLLCSNFVSLYDREGAETVCLDDAATKLGVERRRIYDIVNVLESVGVLNKNAKNRYLWIGFKGIPGALQKLKEDAMKEHNVLSLECSDAKVSDDEEKDKMSDQINDDGGGISFIKKEEATKEHNGLSLERLVAKLSDDEEKYKMPDQNDDDGEGISSTNNTSANPSCGLERKEKSLGQLTQNFVKLLLTTTADMVSLFEAAKLLLGVSQDHPSNMRTNAAKVRRLYDIANVLSSLNLIEKTYQSDTKKPAFRWLGTKGLRDSVVTASVAPAAQQLGKRIFGTDLTNVNVKRRVVSVSSVDNKPNKIQMPDQDLRECSISTKRQLKASKPFVFGPFNPPKPLQEVFEEKVPPVLDFEGSASSLCPSYHNSDCPKYRLVVESVELKIRIVHNLPQFGLSCDPKQGSPISLTAIREHRIGIRGSDELEATSCGNLILSANRDLFGHILIRYIR